jgi:hypothetical protein
MTTLPAVIAVGQHSPRWLYAERIEGPCYVGRVWTRKLRAGDPEPHWSRTRQRFSVASIGRAIPSEPKPEPPTDALASAAAGAAADASAPPALDGGREATLMTVPPWTRPALRRRLFSPGREA